MNYLYYKSDKKYAEGLLDRRSCLMILLAEAKLSNRTAVVPKFALGSQHNHGKRIESYLIGTYLEIGKLGVDYILEEDFRQIEKQIPEDEILNIEDKPFDFKTKKQLVIRNLKDDNFWSLKKTFDVFSLAKQYHGVGVKFVVPLVTAPEKVKAIGNKILDQLQEPVVGLHLRRGDRLNKKLKNGMAEKAILNKLSQFEYKSVFYCTNDRDYHINHPNYFSSKDFSEELAGIEDNYLLFAIEMYIVDHCDISVRTFNDSSPFYFIESTQEKNYAICDYSMHGSNNRFRTIPNQLVKCNYESKDSDKRKAFVKPRPLIPTVIKVIRRKLNMA